MGIRNRVVEDYQIDPWQAVYPAPLTNQRSLEGRVAVVSGSSRGLGRAIAVALAQHGATIVVNYRISEKEAETVCATANAFSSEALAVQADVCSPKDCEHMVDQVLTQYDRIDILVNGVSHKRRCDFHQATMESWDDTVNAGLMSAVYLTRSAINPMRQRGRGRIVNISDIAAVNGEQGNAAQAAAKAGLFGLTKSLAHENAEYGITVNCVVPGWIESRALLQNSEAELQRLSSAIPMKRFGRPEEVAETVRFLVSDAAAYVTGQTLHVNGGLWMP